MLEGDALPAPGKPHQHGGLAIRNGEGEAVEDGARTERFMDVVELNHETVARRQGGKELIATRGPRTHPAPESPGIPAPRRGWWRGPRPRHRPGRRAPGSSPWSPPPHRSWRSSPARTRCP